MNRKGDLRNFLLILVSLIGRKAMKKVILLNLLIVIATALFLPRVPIGQTLEAAKHITETDNRTLNTPKVAIDTGLRETFCSNAPKKFGPEIRIHSTALNPSTTISSGRQSVSASPDYFTFFQPDGTSFRARKSGDEFYHWMETEDGWTIAWNKSRKRYEYLDAGEDGAFYFTALKVGVDNPSAAWIPKHVRQAPEIAKELWTQAKQTSLESAPLDQGALVHPTGTVKNLVILANFSDTTTTYTQADFDGLFNTTGYSQHGANGSVKDYYLEASYGSLVIDTTVSHWVTLPHTMAYYGANGGGIDGNDVRDKEMIEDAIAALEADGFNFAPFDVDGDEWIDSFSVIHQGRGEEAGGSPDTIWSHAGAINPVKVDGIWIGRYHTEPEIYGSELSTIGVICHEFGHILGLPDLYDTDQSSSGIGKWGIMATGCWNNSGRRPAHFCSWSKIKLGWISPNVLYSSRDTINITKLSGNPQAYKINSGMASNEYLLLENRQRTGNTFDDGLPYAGLLVYHIDNNRANNNDENNYMVGLLQADGRWDLENGTNRGDSGDPFPGSTNNRKLGPNTIPNTNSYYNGRTDIEISNISLPADMMSFSLSLSNGYVIYVDPNATAGEKNGTSWTNAFLYLQDALEFASALDDICEIRVAGGIYTPDKNANQPYGNNDRQATFQLINAVVIKGGYAGLAAENPAERDPNKYQTILSGDLAGNDIAISDVTELLDEPTRAENSIHVITASNTNETAVMDGLTITAGRADDSYPHNSGSAMYNNSGSPKLISCKFIHNSAPQGNTIFNLSDSNPTLINCTFTRNYGGGICNSHGSSPTLADCRFIEEYNGGLRNYDNSNPTLIDCTFTDNSADPFGGGMYNLDSNPKLTNCTFINNRANGGGAMSNSGDSNVELNNCIFVGNSALNSGGAIWNIMHANAMLTNCVFNRNSAGSNGGGLYNTSAGDLTLSNCILWDNINGQIQGTADVSYSVVQDGWTGLGNINADPFFADANNGDYHLKSQVGRWDPGSQTWVKDNVTSPCIDAGNPGCTRENEPDPAGSRINMGAYGRTDQASKSPENWRSLADLTNDWIVDVNDLKAFVGFWLRKGECIPGDLNRDHSVDFKDSTIFGKEWTEKRPGPTIYYQIAPCIPTSPPTQPRFSVTVDSPHILFYDLMPANCCPDEIELQMTVENNIITIYEIVHASTPCPCICDYPITATLGPFKPGTYTLYVYQDGGFIGMTSVYIEPAS